MGGRYKDGNKFDEEYRNVDQLKSNLKCHYDENHIFSIEAILKHNKGVARGGPGVPVTPLSQAFFNQRTFNRW